MNRTRRHMREARRLRSRRVRAVLAAGLVLGVGAAATLAAWNDSEHSTATFTAGYFDIVGAADGVTFASHPSDVPAALSFVVAPTAMAPGQTTYALFSVKTVNPSVAGNLQVNAVSTGGTGLGSVLKYGLRTVASASCNETTYNAGSAVVVVVENSSLTTNGASVQPVAANGAGVVHYCFAVTLPSDADNAAQGKTAVQTWQIVGTSS